MNWRALANKRALGYLSWRRRRRFAHVPSVLAEVVADAKARDFDHIAVTGDLTHVGLPAECAAAADWLRALGSPAQVTVVPGNHDTYVRADWATTVGCWKDYLLGDEGEESDEGAGWDAGSRRPTLRVRNGVALVGVNCAVSSPPLFATGRVGPAQLDALAALLDDLGERGLFRMVLIHHSPLPSGHRWRKRLTDAPQLLALLRKHGAELVVHGHGHVRRTDVISGREGETLVVAAPSASLIGDGRGGYNGYTISGDAGGWQVGVSEYAHHPDGVRESAQTDYRLGRRVSRT